MLKVRNHTMVHDQVSRFFNGFRRDAHPMAIMVGVVGALSAFYHNGLDIEDVKPSKNYCNSFNRENPYACSVELQIHCRSTIHLPT